MGYIMMMATRRGQTGLVLVMVVIVSLMLAVGTILTIMVSMGGNAPIESSAVMLVMGRGAYGVYLEDTGSASLLLKVESPGGVSTTWHWVNPDIPYYLNSSAPVGFPDESSATLLSLSNAYTNSSVSVQVQNGPALTFSGACPNGYTTFCGSNGLAKTLYERTIVIGASTANYGGIGIPVTVLSTPLESYGTSVFVKPGTTQQVQVLNGTYEIEVPQSYTFNQRQGWLGTLGYVSLNGRNETLANGGFSCPSYYCAIKVATNNSTSGVTSLTFMYNIGFGEYLQIGSNIARFTSVSPGGQGTAVTYWPPNSTHTFFASTTNYFLNSSTTTTKYNMTSGGVISGPNTTYSSSTVSLWRPVWTVPSGSMTLVNGCGNGNFSCEVKILTPDIATPLMVSAEYCSFPGSATFYWCNHEIRVTHFSYPGSNNTEINGTTTTVLNPSKPTKMSEMLVSFKDKDGPINLGSYGDVQAWIGDGPMQITPPPTFAYTDMVSTGEIPGGNYTFNVRPDTTPPPGTMTFQTPILGAYQISAVYRSGIYEVTVNGTAQSIIGAKNITGLANITGFASVGLGGGTEFPMIHGVFGTTLVLVSISPSTTISIIPGDKNYSSMNFNAAWI